MLKPSDIPADFPVRPCAPDAAGARTCGDCGLSWNDAVPTAWTPAPSGRCPFEYFHADADARREYVRRPIVDAAPDALTLALALAIVAPDEVARIATALAETLADGMDAGAVERAKQSALDLVAGE